MAFPGAELFPVSPPSLSSSILSPTPPVSWQHDSFSSQTASRLPLNQELTLHEAAAIPQECPMEFLCFCHRRRPCSTTALPISCSPPQTSYEPHLCCLPDLGGGSKAAAALLPSLQCRGAAGWSHSWSRSLQHGAQNINRVLIS